MPALYFAYIMYTHRDKNVCVCIHAEKVQRNSYEQRLHYLLCDLGKLPNHFVFLLLHLPDGAHNCIFLMGCNNQIRIINITVLGT